MNRIVLKAIAAIVAVAAIIAAAVIFTAADEPEVTSPESITDFIRDCGYNVASPITKEITIPEEWSEVYENYNKLQKEQGFDLSRYKGEAAVSYTFPVIGYVNKQGEKEEYVEIHIIVCNEKIVGGDIASTRLNGFMEPLR